MVRIFRSALAWLLGVLIILGMMAGSIGRLISRARIHRFGLVGGSTHRVNIKRLGNVFNRLAGMPKVTFKSLNLSIGSRTNASAT